VIVLQFIICVGGGRFDYLVPDPKSY